MVKVTVWRRRKELTLDVKVGELVEDEQPVAAAAKGESAPAAPSDTVKALGLSLANLTPELRERFGLSDDRGRCRHHRHRQCRPRRG